MVTDLTNYYILARRAMHDENYKDAIRFYETVLLNNPNDWEARFYTYYAQAELADFSDLDDRLNVFADALYNIFSVLVQTDMPDDWRTEHVLQCTRYMTTLPLKITIKSCEARREAIIMRAYELSELYQGNFCRNLLACYRLCYTYCDVIEFYFDNNDALLKEILDLRIFLGKNHVENHKSELADSPYADDSIAYSTKNINKSNALAKKLNFIND